MARSRPTCFVIMPFTPTLNYFVLYLSEYVERMHGVVCYRYRADQKFSTKPVREKISDHLRIADFIIADCTGNNPNVLYELGIAHALEQDTVLITQDAMTDVPSDIRPFEFIKYDLSHHQEFLAKLDGAISELLVGRYDRLFAEAEELFRRYKREANRAAQSVPKAAFLARAKAAERSEGLPSSDDVFAFAEFVLPAIVQDSDEVAVMSSISSWLLQLR